MPDTPEAKPPDPPIDARSLWFYATLLAFMMLALFGLIRVAFCGRQPNQPPPRAATRDELPLTPTVPWSPHDAQTTGPGARVDERSDGIHLHTGTSESGSASIRTQGLIPFELCTTVAISPDDAFEVLIDEDRVTVRKGAGTRDREIVVHLPTARQP